VYENAAHMIDASWLRGLGKDRLAEVLTRRPEAAMPAPGSLNQLAERLTNAESVVAAMRRLNRATLQVAEALAALGGQADPGPPCPASRM